MQAQAIFHNYMSFIQAFMLWWRPYKPVFCIDLQTDHPVINYEPLGILLPTNADQLTDAPFKEYRIN